MRLSWQYVAGFFDGEGSLGTYTNGARAAGQTVVSIAQAGERGRQLLQLIAAFFVAHGVASTIDVRRPAVKRHAKQTIYVLRVCGRKSVEIFCRKVRPYVFMKKVVVEDTLRWMVAYPPVVGAHFRELNADRKASGWYQRKRGA